MGRFGILALPPRPSEAPGWGLLIPQGGTVWKVRCKLTHHPGPTNFDRFDGIR